MIGLKTTDCRVTDFNALSPSATEPCWRLQNQQHWSPAMQDGRVPLAEDVASLFLLGEAEALVFSLAPISTHSLQFKKENDSPICLNLRFSGIFVYCCINVAQYFHIALWLKYEGSFPRKAAVSRGEQCSTLPPLEQTSFFTLRNKPE